MTDAMTRSAMAGCLISLALLISVPLFQSAYLIDVVTEILIYALFALSLNVIIGYSGNVSFGHAAYFAIGGYTNAILLTSHGWALVPSFVTSILVTMIAAGFVAYFCTRLTNIYFAMLTLAFSMLVWAIAFKWRSVTGGDDGFVGIRVPEIINNRAHFYYFACTGLQVSGDEIEERRFAGTIWTNDGMSFPLNEFKIDRSDRSAIEQT